MRMLGLLALFTLVAFGQNAQITGRITDSSGAIIPGASVVVANIGTGIDRKAVSNEEGYYTVPFLQPGAYKVSVQFPGFKPVTREQINLDVAQIARIDFTLELGQLSEALTVVSTAPLLQSESAQLYAACDADPWRRERR
jgi:carboxypeptidase family protein